MSPAERLNEIADTGRVRTEYSGLVSLCEADAACIKAARERLREAEEREAEFIDAFRDINAAVMLASTLPYAAKHIAATFDKYPVLQKQPDWSRPSLGEENASLCSRLAAAEQRERGYREALEKILRDPIGRADMQDAAFQALRPKP